MSPAEESLVSTETQLYQENLAQLQAQATQQQQTQQAFEEATGMSYSDYLASTAEDQAAINKAYADQIKAGLAGTEPVSPALTQSLTQQAAALEEKYAKSLGSGYATSDPYIRAETQFEEEAAALTSASKTGAVTMGEQLGYATPTSLISPYVQMTTPQQIQSPLQTTGLYDLYQYQQGLQQQSTLAGYNAQVEAALGSAQSQGAMTSGLFGLGGSLGGAAILGAFLA